MLVELAHPSYIQFNALWFLATLAHSQWYYTYLQTIDALSYRWFTGNHQGCQLITNLKCKPFLARLEHDRRLGANNIYEQTIKWQTVTHGDQSTWCVQNSYCRQHPWPDSPQVLLMLVCANCVSVWDRANKRRPTIIVNGVCDSPCNVTHGHKTHTHTHSVHFILPTNCKCIERSALY